MRFFLHCRIWQTYAAILLFACIYEGFESICAILWKRKVTSPKIEAWAVDFLTLCITSIHYNILYIIGIILIQITSFINCITPRSPFWISLSPDASEVSLYSSLFRQLGMAQAIILFFWPSQSPKAHHFCPVSLSHHVWTWLFFHSHIISWDHFQLFLGFERWLGDVRDWDEL